MIKNILKTFGAGIGTVLLLIVMGLVVFGVAYGPIALAEYSQDLRFLWLYMIHVIYGCGLIVRKDAEYEEGADE